ncbi:MAG: transporter substrate-binding domain-containing protein [bacterium]
MFNLNRFFLLFLLFFTINPFLFSKTLKVGVYENNPKVYVDEKGNPSGIFVDVINEIAKENHWQLEFVSAKWVELVRLIEKNEIDVLLDAALTEERTGKMKFNKLPLLKSWIQIYTLSSNRINFESELKGKKIGMLTGSKQEEFFEDYYPDFNIDMHRYISYKDSVAGLKNHEVDAIVVSRFFYFSNLRSSEIVPAPVVFKPNGLYFAFSNDTEDEVITKFDKAISELKNDPYSIFYSSLNKYLKTSQKEFIPKWLYKIILIISAALIFFIVFSYFLRIQVKRKSVLAEKRRDALSRSENKYKELVELAADGILLGSNEGIIIEANSRMEQILGKTKEEIVGLHISKIFPEEALSRTPLDFESLKKGKVIINEREFIKPDGKKALLEMHTKMMPDGTYQSIYRDITERKKISEISAKNQKLESIGLLAGGIAHDFNNLLSGVYGYIELSRMSCGNKEKCRKYTEAAIKSLDRAKSLTHQLLTFSKGGAPVIKPEKVGAFVKDIIRFALSGSKCSCEFKFDDNLMMVCMDKNQIGQVLENIVINAQQSMPSGGTVTVYASNFNLPDNRHPVLEKGKYVRISVEDSGIGIPTEHMDKIFDPFFSSKKTGSGLGLSVAHSILLKHKGYIDLDSVLGKGSVFHIYLPAAESSKNTEKKKTDTHSLHKGSGKVIIMDDNDEIRDLLVNFLSRMGYDAVECSGGKEAVDLYRKLKESQQNVRFMIFDLTVPGGMGGVEAVKKIRDFDKDIPVFVSSGYAENPALSNPAEYGFSAGIAKPFSIKELSKLLKFYFSSS